jgi:non-heme chloroperoxidase
MGSGGVRVAGDPGAVHRDHWSWLLQHVVAVIFHAWKRTGEVLGAAGYHAVAFRMRAGMGIQTGPRRRLWPDHMVQISSVCSTR